MNTQTEAALEKAYEVFAEYQSDVVLAKQSGVSHSLRDLTREDWDAMNQHFDMAVLLYSDGNLLLRHYLPRFLEWNIDAPVHGWLDWWSLSYRLDYARWKEWPAFEVEALNAVFDAWIREELARDDGEMPIDFLLEIQFDVLPYLEVWLEKRPHEMAHWLWTLDWQENQSVWQWATQPHVEAALEAAFFHHPDGPRAQSISRAIELIRSLRG